MNDLKGLVKDYRLLGTVYKIPFHVQDKRQLAFFY